MLVINTRVKWAVTLSGLARRQRCIGVHVAVPARHLRQRQRCSLSHAQPQACSQQPAFRPHAWGILERDANVAGLLFLRLPWLGLSLAHSMKRQKSEGHKIPFPVKSTHIRERKCIDFLKTICDKQSASSRLWQQKEKRPVGGSANNMAVVK